MIKFAVVVCAIAGVVFLAGHAFPSAYNVAFHLGNYGVSYIVLLGLAMGFGAMKITK